MVVWEEVSLNDSKSLRCETFASGAIPDVPESQHGRATDLSSHPRNDTATIIPVASPASETGFIKAVERDSHMEAHIAYCKAVTLCAAISIGSFDGDRLNFTDLSHTLLSTLLQTLILDRYQNLRRGSAARTVGYSRNVTRGFPLYICEKFA
ncbi:hypothetical protein KCU91_g14, partial [Aureobasidium melanogenum]